METIFVTLKNREEKKEFPKPKSVSLINIINGINKMKLSLEEAEKRAGVKQGVILRAIKNNDMLPPMEAVKLSKLF